MVDKTKISRKKKKQLTKKNFYPENEKSLTPGLDSHQSFDSPKLAFDENIKPYESPEPSKKIEKSNFSKSSPNKYLLFEIVSLVLLTVIIYGGTLNHSFHLDDGSNISSNKLIQISNLSIDELVKAGFESFNRKRPVANISFALNYYFHGLDVKGYHIVNIIIHLLAGIMLYYFVKITLSIRLARDKFAHLAGASPANPVGNLYCPAHEQYGIHVLYNGNAFLCERETNSRKGKKSSVFYYIFRSSNSCLWK
jgi:hypothetical protein